MNNRRLATLRAGAWAVLTAEMLATALWPLAAALAALAALALSGAVAWMPDWLHLAVALAAAGCLIRLARQAASGLRLPDARASERRLERDSGLRHRPFTTLRDVPAGAAAATVPLWLSHQARAHAALDRLRLRGPQPRLAAHDPFALRAAAILLLVAALVAAGPQAWPRLAGFLMPGGSWSLASPSPAIQAWIQPPPYTGLPPVFLPEAGGSVTVPTGSRLTLSITAAATRPHLTLADGKLPMATLGPDSYQSSVVLTRPGLLRVGARFSRLAAWTLHLLPNEPPMAAWARLPGRAGTSAATALPWTVAQRWGVASLEAELRPQGHAELPPLRVRLPLPGTPKQATGAATLDLSANPYAGLTVTGRLDATDVSGQHGRGAPADFVLPARTFHHPLARAIADLRRRLALHPGQPDRAAVDLAALAELPPAPPVPGLSPAGVTLNLAAAAAILAAARPTLDAINAVQARLWLLSLALDGALPDAAAAALDQARENLRRGLEEHALGKLSDKALAQQLDALRQALDKRLTDIARQAMKQGALEKFDPANQHLSSDAMDRAINRLERALKEGRTADARQALAELNRMMDQLKNAHVMSKEEARQQEQQRKQGRQQMGALQDMVQRETGLLDHAQSRAAHQPPAVPPGLFSDAPLDQPPAGNMADPTVAPDSPPATPAPPPALPGQTADARVQRALHRALDALKQGLRQSGRTPPAKLDEAGQAMQDAAGALAHQDDPTARDAVGRAIAALQSGGQSMSHDQQGQGGGGLALSLQPGGKSGSGGAGEADGDDGKSRSRAQRDPLGRQVDGSGPVGDDPDLRLPNEMEQGRSRAIQQELRRRGADRQRPRGELDYIDRLLKPF